MFSIGKTDPRLYKRIFASAGMSCVVVTNTFTQLLLWDAETADVWGCWTTATSIDTEKNYTVKGHLELIIDRDLSACVSQESVRASTSALSCSQASLLAGPSRPKNRPESEFVLMSQTDQSTRCMSSHSRQAGLPPTLFLYVLYNSLTRL